MPIRINLLAEAHAAEEARRKDPVKRGAYIGAFLIFCVVLWSGTLQMKLFVAKVELGSVKAKWSSIEKPHKITVDAQKARIEEEKRLADLHQVSTNRFLWGPALNAFQQTTVDGIQVVKIKTEQTFVVSEGTPSRTNGTTVIAGKPATATERVSMSIDAMDASSLPGRSINPFREAFAKAAFFKENLTKTNGVMLVSRSAPQNSPSGDRTFVMFSLKATFPEKTR
jgi:hypothetical protein